MHCFALFFGQMLEIFWIGGSIRDGFDARVCKASGLEKCRWKEDSKKSVERKFTSVRKLDSDLEVLLTF